MVDPKRSSKKTASLKKTAKKATRKKNLPASPTITGDMTSEELAFVKAIDEFKRQNNRPFLTWREVLEIVKSLGYAQIDAQLDEDPEIPNAAEAPPADLV